MTAVDFEARVREIAHTLWVEEGRPDGRAEDHWFRALAIAASEAKGEEKAATPAKKRAPAKPRAKKAA